MSLIIIFLLLLWIHYLQNELTAHKRLIDENTKAIWHLNSRILEKGPFHGLPPKPPKSPQTPT
jgi:hypothetical protein